MNSYSAGNGRFGPRFFVLVLSVSLLVAALVAVSTASAQDRTRAAANSSANSYNELARKVLRDPNVAMNRGVRRDIVSGVASRRVLRVVNFAGNRYPVTVSSIRTGHHYAHSRTLRAWVTATTRTLTTTAGPWTSPTLTALRSLPAMPPRGCCRAGSTTTSSPGTGKPLGVRAGLLHERDHKNHIHTGWLYGR